MASACSGGLKQVLVPGQRLRSGRGGDSTKSQPLDQWSVTRTWPYGFAEKEFPQRWKVVKQVKCSLGEKRIQYVWIGTWPGSERESRPRGSLNHLIWGISSGFPLANHFDLPGSKFVFGVSQALPMSAHAPLSQGGFYRRGLWVDLAT